MSIEEPGRVVSSEAPETGRRPPRRRWRTLQNRIERARRLRHAEAVDAKDPGRDKGTTTGG